MTQLASREFQLVRFVSGPPEPDDFRIVERILPEPAPGEVRVVNHFLSVDPYMRGRMSGVASYVPAYQLDEPLDGGAVGQVEASAHPDFPVGGFVLSRHGWREAFVASGDALVRIDTGIAPPQAYLGVLGMPGLTAYVGLFTIGGLRDGETVLVSGAAGAVGSIVCQIAKNRGCRVIAVAGTDEKLAWLEREAGVDVAINYRTVPSLRHAIRAAAGDGVDLTFENVGGEHLEAAFACSKTFGRVVLCGLISRYNATEAGGGIRNIADVLTRRLVVRGFIVFDHHDRRPEFSRAMTGWIAAGRMKWTETIVDGFEQLPAAFAGLFTGANLGKMVVRL